ncbi:MULTISPECIES: UPF0182 family protein [unclassified Rathayibacter]|uniref:UPF0182 family membrane protein n=1 Tax=unclassified Rathayibacter TaxID=2609250 RepID=UPI000FACCA9C|nr:MULTISPECIES: UPF0182 family protein [unclassified Rathayibacter]MCJ1672313.1 UPF0182 family protein [Rathayibacter sp. VKM Ac-2929]MCJ1685103.1 UPF0182 family protein [Rathayibacter sp. VKM Ac-2928]ROP43438.1 hypothetical protein EDF45_4085 [Rathayibacter sp. PhB186]ROS46594.1 hypothetical protein EDF44_4069 [Rathayibacter sp. PhB185]
MSSAATEAPPRKRRSVLAVTVVVVAVLVVAFFVFAGLYTDILWYDQLGFLSVLTTQWFAAGGLFVIGFVAMAVPVFVSLTLAYRLRPVYAKLNSQIDRYQQVVEPLRRLATFGIPAVLGLFAGVSSSTRWQTSLTFWNRTPSGDVDPLFGLDTSFYLFELPFYQSIVGFASAVLIISALATLATGYLYGAIRINGREIRISKSSRIQLAIIAALYLLVQAVSLWLDQYATLSRQGTRITGATYASVNATIPGLQILAAISALIAVLFIITAFIGRWRLPVIGTALLIVASLLVGSLYPWVVQKFQVEPNERTLESTYIQDNIDMTRQAYGVSDVEVIPYDATTDAEPGALRSDAETTANIRILDPAVVTDAFSQLQQFRQYYSFGDQQNALDVDRYSIDGSTQDAVVGVRELNLNGLGTNQTWYNQTLVYTHGYGLVAAYGNQRSSDGEPVFIESGVPTTGDLGDYEPRIYFGENSPGYSIVGGDGDRNIELDYPSGTEGEQQTYTTFDGNGGPSLDNVFKKLVYAIKFQSEQIFLSDGVNDQSQILYDRDPVQRVQKVAPYLTLDSDAYPTVVDGRVVWVVDGYTTSADYPYSEVQSLSQAIADTNTQQQFPTDDVNYIRNSVKATVDAYDGSVTLYAWDTEDPILQTWQKIFPSTVEPISEMSAGLLSHVRYPEDLFKVQRAVLGTYHVTDAGSFYSREAAWSTPNDPTSGGASTAAVGGGDTLQPPYYLTLQTPDVETPSYSLYSTYIPASTPGSAASRNVLTGYLVADSDAGSTEGAVADGYGTLRLLELPSDDTVPGPGQVQNAFNTDPTVANQLALLQRGDTTVTRGNLLTLPVGGGLLYVQPIYVSSNGDTSFPLLQKVLVAFGDDIAFEDTLDAALDSLFGGDSGADAGDTGTVVTPTPTPTDTADPGTGDTGTGDAGTGGTAPTGDQTELQAALSDASTALAARETALKAGDLTAFAAADEQLTEALQRALAAEGQQ